MLHQHLDDRGLEGLGCYFRLPHMTHNSWPHLGGTTRTNPTSARFKNPLVTSQNPSNPCLYSPTGLTATAELIASENIETRQCRESATHLIESPNHLPETHLRSASWVILLSSTPKTSIFLRSCPLPRLTFQKLRESVQSAVATLQIVGYHQLF